MFARTVNAFFHDYCGADKIPMVYGFPGERHRLVGEKILHYRAIEPVGEFRIPPSSDTAALAVLERRHLRHFGHPRAATYSAIRDESYLTWRYLSHPSHRYLFVATRRFPWRSYEMVAIVREKEDQIVVMELEGVFSTRAVRRLIGVLASLGKPVGGWLSPSHPRTDLLRAEGVEVTNRDHQLEARFFNGRQIPKRGEFHYSLGDYDVD